MRVLLLFLALAPLPAHANGVYTHVHVARLAMDLVGPGPLRDALADPRARQRVEVGAMLPDGRNGHLVSWYHWETFFSAAVQRWQARHPDPSTPEARDEALFLLGAAVHGITDPVYDQHLLARSLAVDPAMGPISVDVVADYFIVRDLGVALRTDEVWRDDLDGWLPVDLILEAYALDRIGPSPFIERNPPAPIDLDEATIRAAFEDIASVLAFQGIVGQTDQWRFGWIHHPFLFSYLDDPAVPGSIPDTAALSARYMEVLWARLHGTDDPRRDMILRFQPADGAVNVPVERDDTRVLDNVGVITGYGILTRQVQDFVRLLDEDGAPVPVRVDAPYDREVTHTDKVHATHLLVPLEPLRYDHAYTIEVLPGLSSISGEVLDTRQVATFRTRCAPDRLGDCPPLEPPLEPLPPPWERPMPKGDTGTTGETQVPTEAPPPPDAPAPDPEPASGCGCVQSGLSAGWLWVGLALYRRRR